MAGLVALGAVLGLAVLPGLLPTPAPASAAASSSATAGPDQPVVDRVLRDERIGESSGLAPSGRDSALLWTHNDSGNPAQLFAVRANGRTAATVRVTGVRGVDWEALAAFRDSRGRPMLAVADIGDNGAARATVEIVVLPEPAVRNATVRPERVIRLRYPTGPVDAEALLVDPDGRRAFVLTKGLGGRIYQVPPAAWSSSAAVADGVLTLRAGVPLLFVTDGVMGPGGHPVVRTYSELAVLPPIGDDVSGGTLQPVATLRLPRQQQGEALTLRDARTALVGSEGAGTPILRVPLPADVVAALGARGSPATGATAATRAPTSRPATASPGAAAEPGRSRSGRVGAAATFVVLAGLVVVVVVTTRARR